MKECGVYRVTEQHGPKTYRGHDFGVEFVAQLNRGAERRAIDRGSIIRIGTVVPAPGPHTLPGGWTAPETHDREGA